jgi:CBS domain-containing protein
MGGSAAGNVTEAGNAGEASKMSRIHRLTLAAVLLQFTSQVHAEEVDLPFPFLEWSVYVLLLFGLVVAVGIFIRRSKGETAEPLSKLMEERRAAVHSVRPDVSVTECVRQMNELKIGAMLVMEGDRLAGIFTERDAMTRVLGGGLDPTQTAVSEVMSPDPVCVTPSTTLEEARALVTARRIRHLPVVDDGRVVGIVSSGDLTHWLVRDQSLRIGNM